MTAAHIPKQIVRTLTKVGFFYSERLRLIKNKPQDPAFYLEQFHDAIERGDVITVRAIYDIVHSRNWREAKELLKSEYKGYTALQRAALYGNIQIVAFLLDKKALTNTESSENGRSALLCALAEPEGVEVNREHKEWIFHRLADTGPQYATVDKKGNNILHYAVMGGYFEAFQRLIDEDLGYLLGEKNAEGQNGHNLIKLHNRKEMDEYLTQYLANHSELSLSQSTSPYLCA